MAIPVGGVKSVIIDGKAVDVLAIGGFSIAEQKRETVEVIAGTPGHRVIPAIPYIEIDISTRGIKVADYVAQEGVTVQLNLANGKSYVWANAHEVGDGAVDPQDGKLSLRYESETAKEL